MNREFLITILQNIQNAKREYRNEAALKIIENPDLHIYLIQETFHTEDILSVRASWILEWICTHKGLNIILPHLDIFTKNLNKLHFGGSLRTCAKICEHIAIAYTSKTSHAIQKVLTQKQINSLVEVSFDWLLTEQKIAVKAYSMHTLYLFGLEIDWIHNSLEEIIKKDIIHLSKSCESRGKKIISLIHKIKNI